MSPQQPEEEAHPQCQSRGGTHHCRRIDEKSTQYSYRWVRGLKSMYTSTTTLKIELGNGPTGHTEAASETATMMWMTVRGNRIKNG